MESNTRFSLLPFGILGMLFILCCCAPFAIPVALNELQLRNFAQGLFDYPLPPSTRVLRRETEISHPGNGNTCDYDARLVLLSTLSEAEIRSYYKNVWLPGVSDNSWRSKNVTLVKVRFNDEAPTNGERQFTVTLNDAGPDEATFDFRCH